jgi:DNA-binding NarL/FixJ family response regulator
MSTRVLLVDDQELIRLGFRTVIDAHEKTTVVGEAADGEEAVRLSIELEPDVVLMDVRMPGTDGIEATRRITQAPGDVKVLILTTFDLDSYAFSALRVGASGFLVKDVPPEDLLSAIDSVARGDAVVSPGFTRRLLDSYAHLLPREQAESTDPPDPLLDRLTDREREVLLEVAAGYSNGEIATRLFVTEATVKSHVGSIFMKLGLRSRVQAVIFAYDHDLVAPARHDAK